MKSLLIIIVASLTFPAIANAYTGGVRGYQRPSDPFLLSWTDHAYTCRVDSSSTKASYCELDNVYLWGSTPCKDERDHYNTAWKGDGDCDPGNMAEYGDDGGDCELPGEGTIFYCKGVEASGSGSSQNGGEVMGSTYSWDNWFYNNFSYTQAQLEDRYENVANEVGTCEISYGVDGVCHQHANRGWWFSASMPVVLDFDIGGSSTSDTLYGSYGGGWNDCYTDQIAQ